MPKTMYIHLPVLGLKQIKEDPNQPGHYLWLNNMGWHDCFPAEDKFIQEQK